MHGKANLKNVTKIYDAHLHCNHDYQKHQRNRAIVVQTCLQVHQYEWQYVLPKNIIITKLFYHGSGGAKRPTASAMTLTFDRCNHIFCSPINACWQIIAHSNFFGILGSRGTQLWSPKI